MKDLMSIFGQEVMVCGIILKDIDIYIMHHGYHIDTFWQDGE